MAESKSLNEENQQKTTDQMIGAKILLECLRKEGVDEIFGYPGGVVLHIYDELYKCDFIKHYIFIFYF